MPYDPQFYDSEWYEVSLVNPHLGLAFLTPTITATSERVSHPASNLGVIQKWRRTWRSEDAGTQRITADFGSATTIAGVFLNYLNFAAVGIEASNDGSAWTNIAGFGVLMDRDERVGRRKVWIPASTFSPAFNHRYLRVNPAVIDAPSPGYFEAGVLAFPLTDTLTRNFGSPWRWTAIEAVSRTLFPGGGAETNREGPRRLVYELQYGPNRTDGMGQLLQLQNLGVGRPFFLWENRGVNAHAYILERTEDVPFSESFRILDAGTWRCEEAM